MAQKLKTTLALVGLSVVAIVAADLVGRVAAAVDERYFDPPTNQLLADDDLRAGLPAYDGVDYDPRSLLEEVRKSDRTVYEPYTIWKRRPYRGEYTTIDLSGSRRTVGNSSSEDALDIWVFGGSAVWGVGAPDRETIPSHLAALLNGELGIDASVRNLGRRGYVSTQEVIYLMRELQAGRRPDVVVFYNGVNDAAAVSLWPEFPGAHVSFDTVRDRFESNGEDGDFGWFARSTGLYKASRIVLDRVEGEPFERDGIIVYADHDTDSRPNYRWLAERGTRPLALQLPRGRCLGEGIRVHTPDGIPARTVVELKSPSTPPRNPLSPPRWSTPGSKSIMTVRAEMAARSSMRDSSDPQTLDCDSESQRPLCRHDGAGLYRLRTRYRSGQRDRRQDGSPQSC